MRPGGGTVCLTLPPLLIKPLRRICILSGLTRSRGYSVGVIAEVPVTNEHAPPRRRATTTPHTDMPSAGGLRRPHSASSELPAWPVCTFLIIDVAIEVHRIAQQCVGGTWDNILCSAHRCKLVS